MRRDVTTILLNPKAFQYTIDLFADRYREMKIDVVAGVHIGSTVVIHERMLTC